MRLLATRLVGRVAFTHEALPAILPVTYRLQGGDVVFSTGSGSDPLAVIREQVIGFEVDSMESVSEPDWAVLVVGVARHLDEEDPAWPALRNLKLCSWGGKRATELIRLSTEAVTGRCLIGKPFIRA